MVYQVTVLIEAKTLAAAEAAINVTVGVRHSEPRGTAYGYLQTLPGHLLPDSVTSGIAESKLTKKLRKPRGPLSAEHKVALLAGKQQAREKRQQEALQHPQRRRAPVDLIENNDRLT